MSKIRLIVTGICLYTVSMAYPQQRRKTDMLELPAYSNATIHTNQVIYHTSYTVSFNAKHKIPNWVAWRLEGKNTDGQIGRDYGIFERDPEISSDRCPDGDAYKYSGYDRGHMCPAADNKWSLAAMRECFYMSNMCPQKHELNDGLWKKLEERCRTWASMYQEIYIVCGPVIPQRVRRRIGEGVTIPYYFYKAVLRIDRKGYHVIGFLFTQDNERRVVTIDEIEQQTGLDLFHNLPDHIEAKIESTIDTASWPGL